MIKALVFDFDGTIIDTETPWYYAFRERYKSHGVELTLEKYSQCVGTSLHQFNPYTYLMTEHGLPIDEEEFRAAVHRDHAEWMGKEQIRPGVINYLEAAKAAGLKIGLASSSKRDWIERHLAVLGIGHYFEFMATADDVAKVKPDPELYRLALAGLGVEPGEAVAIEDSPNGARAAAAAGMHCIIVPNELTKLLPFDEGSLNKHAESLADVNFDELVSKGCGSSAVGA
ncbi:HAD family hydrolase [Paenibacillus sp. CAU 1782]